MTRLWPRSLAGQAIALQILVVAVVVLAGSALALLDARRDADEAARQQVVGIATSIADSPSTAEAIESGRATEILQPVTEAVRRHTDIAFITIMSPDRIRFTHTDPTQIGGQYIGTIEPALRGETSARSTPAHWAPRFVRSRRCATDRERSSAWYRRASCRTTWPIDGAPSGRQSPR